MNVVMLGRAGSEPLFVEVQGTAEGSAFTRSELDSLLGAGRAAGSREIMALQAELLAEPPAAAPSASSADARLVCASANPDKVAEIAAHPRRRRRAACPARPTCPTWSRTPTRSRATPGSRRSRSCARPALPAVADDTGLEVDALDGAPGRVHGALRRRGRDVRRELRQAARRARRVPPTARPAFRTVALVRWPDGRELVVEGVVRRADRHRRCGRAAASATTRCSSPTRATAARSAR